ncbi:MAG TPA: radical SAM/Cys-rich domain protein [Gammaproteobacteria bacterium]|nr:radical SAM/Cys-rich domain protein [Gammaproteobacteria bacterium]
MLATLPHLQTGDFPAICRAELQTLQVNLGYLCNQQCLHCHVDAGPKRTEIMTRETVDDVLACLQRNRLGILDLTGGAPELNPHFRYLVREARRLGVHVMDRCNLTVLCEPDQDDLAEFLAEHEVEVFASLPCYLEENVDGQRGQGVFQGSIEGIRRLNAAGYGQGDTARRLNLVYNPTGAFLPPPQCQLEADYRRELRDRFGITFDRLLTLANMPIKRFGSMLLSKGEFDAYLQLLKEAHQDANLETVMCRTLVSVDWQGHLYDCDFNQMLELPLRLAGQRRLHLRDLQPGLLRDNPIVVADHCYGCTAGQGSSCGGALSE